MTTFSVRTAQPDQTGTQNPVSGAARNEPRATERAVFERLLSERQVRRGTGYGGESEYESAAELGQQLQAAAVTLRAPGPQLPRTTAGLSGGVTHHESAGAIRRGDQARMADHAITAPMPTSADSQGSWQAILPNVLGGDWQLRVTREAGSPAGTQNWSMAIGSPVAELALLARHAVRLAERLLERLPGRSVRVSVDAAEAAGAAHATDNAGVEYPPQRDDLR
ncbi:MAG: hypothetical protein GY949_21625 [Gammaproteobacteria bacterium]|nr:hypothetical protein [Gammaproteobacteria bacterium]